MACSPPWSPARGSEMKTRFQFLAAALVLFCAAPAAAAPSIKLVVLDIGGTLIQDHGEVPTAVMSALSKKNIPATAAEIGDWRGASKRGMIRHFVERAMKPGKGADALVETINADFN